MGIPTTGVEKVLLENFLQYFISDVKTQHTEYLDTYLTACQLLFTVQTIFQDIQM